MYYVTQTNPDAIYLISDEDLPELVSFTNPAFSVLDFDYIKSPCMDDLIIKENASTGYQTYIHNRSSNSIITETTNSPNVDVIINSGTTVDFKSNYIALQPGFLVAEGTCFNAVIEPCE